MSALGFCWYPLEAVVVWFVYIYVFLTCNMDPFSAFKLCVCVCVFIACILFSWQLVLCVCVYVF